MLPTGRPVTAGRIRQEIVAPALLEFLAEGGRPVLRPHLPAVDVERRPARLPIRPAWADLAEESPDEGVVVGVEGGSVELVALQAEARHRGGTGVRPRRRPAEAKDGPAAGRHVPGQAPVSRQLAGQVDDARRVDGRARRERRELGRRRDERPDARLGGIGRADIERLLVDVGDEGPAAGVGKASTATSR